MFHLYSLQAGGKWLTDTQDDPTLPRHSPGQPQVSPQSSRVSLAWGLEMGEGSPRYAREECREQSLAPDLNPASAHPTGPSTSGHIRPDV